MMLYNATPSASGLVTSLHVNVRRQYASGAEAAPGEGSAKESGGFDIG